MALIRRPQPPGDNGSRSNLDKNGLRKGKIDGVEHAYSGIINVYALIPPAIDNKGNVILGGDGKPKIGVPISLSDFTHGKIEIQTGSRIYPQNGKKKDLQIPSGRVVYGWSHNGHLHRSGLYQVDENKKPIGSDITTSYKNLYDNIRHYESILDSNPSLVEQPSEDEIGKSAGYINSIDNPVGSDKYELSVFNQAIKLHVYPNQMKKWALLRLPNALHGHRNRNMESDIRYLSQNGKNEDSIKKLLMQEYNLDESKATEVISKYNTKNSRKSLEPTKAENESSAAKEVYDTKGPQQHETIVIDTEKLPRALDTTNGPIDPSRRDEYLPITGDMIKSAPVVYYEKLQNGAIKYYIKMTAERKRKMKNIKMKRVITAYRVKKKNKKITPHKKPSNSNKAKCVCSSKRKKIILKRIKSKGGKRK